MKKLLAIGLIAGLSAQAQAYDGDPRYCGARNVIRDQAVLRSFKRLHPCPAPGPRATCPD